jgi:uncharacterized delta-60 repeat protein
LTLSSFPDAAARRGSSSELLVASRVRVSLYLTVALSALAFVALLLIAQSAGAQQFDNLDPSFGSGGTVLSDLSSGAGAIALQPDGKIVLAGSGADGQGFQELVVTRFNADGSPDSSFGSGGKAAYQLGSGTLPSSGATAVAIQQDGQIVLAGIASDSHNASEAMVARLNGSDGALDKTFDSDGWLGVQLGQGGQSSGLNAVAIQADKKIVVAGQALDSDGNSRFLVARLNGASGSFDSSFGSAGKVLTQIGTRSGTAEQASALAIQSDGKIVVGGQAADSTQHIRFLVARLKASNGGFDSTFGSAGKVLLQLGSGSQPVSAASALAIQPDGKILAGGNASPASGNPAFLVERLGVTGAPDTAFGSGGTVLTQLGSGFNAFSAVASLALQGDGNVVAGGVVTDADGDNALVLARLTGATGDFDSSFGDGGKLVQQVGREDIPSSQATGVAIQPDGRILVGGMANTADNNIDLLLERFFHDVAPSPAFTPQANAIAGTPTAFDGSASSDPDGSIAGYRWEFGDGSSATGAKVSHVYQAAGDYSVRLTVTDDKGLPASLSQKITVAPSNNLNPAVRASISRLGITPPEFVAAARGGSIARRSTGATIAYRDSMAARTTFKVSRAVLGVFSGGHCKALGHGRHGRRCARYLLVGHFSHRDKAGSNSFHFTGRVNRRKLSPGHYRLTARPSAGGHLGAGARASFTIVS